MAVLNVCKFIFLEESDGDRAKRITTIVRLWTYSSLHDALSDKRPDIERQRIMDELYHRYEQILFNDRDDPPFPVVYIHIEKCLV